MIDEERLAEIEARAEKASPGPWKEKRTCFGSMATSLTNPIGGINTGPAYSSNVVTPDGLNVCSVNDYNGVRWKVDEEPDPGLRPELTDLGQFIAHARADVPALCAEVRRLQAVVARLRGRNP